MLSTKFYIIFCIIFVTILQFGNCQFESYPLYHVVPQAKNDLKILKEIESSSDNYIFLNGVHAIDENIYVAVSRHRGSKFQAILNNHKILYKALTNDLHTSIKTETLESSSAFGYACFYYLYRIYDKLNDLEKQYPNMTNQSVIGKTIDGHELRIIKISNQTNKPEIKKPGIFIEGGTQGRSWISPATVIYIMEELLSSKNIVIQSLVNNYDWYFMPILNPDGYVYSGPEKIWNKNRSPQKNFCDGVDLNRNWDMNWRNSTSRSTLKPCLENYPGSHPFSEIETKSLSNFLIDLKKNGSLHLYLSFQSGEQQFFYPYGSTKQKPDNAADLEKIAEVVVKALAQRRGTRYTYGSIFNSRYPIYGTSIDWVYGVQCIPLSFRWDLPYGEPTFRDAAQIIPVAEETFDSVVALIVQAQSMGYFGKI